MFSRKVFITLKKSKIPALFNNHQLWSSNLNLSTHKSYLFQYKLYSTKKTAKEDVLIPLNEISSLEFNHLICDKEKLFKVINEIVYAKSAGRKLPQYIKQSDFEDLIECETLTQRYKYLTYLYTKEMKKLNEAEKKLKRKAERESKITKPLPETDHIQYGIGKNTILLRTWKRSLLRFYDKRLANSILFGQKLVIDLGYDEYMCKKERKACASQVKLLYHFNKLSRDPYDLYFCNANPDGRCVQYLHEAMPNIQESAMTLSEKSYLDFFPKENLVYLSPHASETLKTYDHKAVYIIGGFVDTVKRNHISSCKAKSEGIKSYSLPLTEYVMWGTGSKSLSINQVFSIMQAFRDTSDWREAFKHIPTRKLKRINVDSEETKFLSDKLFVMAN